MDDTIATNLYKKLKVGAIEPISSMTDEQAQAIYNDEQETLPVNLDDLPDTFDDETASNLMKRITKYGTTAKKPSTGITGASSGAYTGNIGKLRKPQRLPVQGKISQEYGVPVGYEKSGRHGGVDIAVPNGTPIPDEGGEVIDAGSRGGYGNSVMVRGQDGVIRRYSHLSTMNVKAGDKIPSGYIIGKSGNTGFSTNPHLDYREYQP